MPTTLYNLAATLPAALLAQTGTNGGTLVEREKLKEVSKHINDGIKHDLPWELLLVGLGLTLVGITLISLHRWWKRRQDDPSALVLFSAIARKAGLGWSDRLTLWRVARANDLPSPIALLLARGALRHYADQYALAKPGRARQRLDRRVARIEAELFGFHSSGQEP